jgi:hypothetical protein
MLNKRPIFINGFQRGGTNILMRLISSHPQVRLLGAEIHEIFYGRETQSMQKWLRRLTYSPVLLATRQHTFWPYRFYSRRPLPAPVRYYVDLLFYLHKQAAPNAYYSENGNAGPTWSERGDARMACKCVNGVVLATPLFAQMYPDATFVALVRHGLAVCEGFVRRGWEARRFGRMYQAICTRMMADANQLDAYHIIRFEDLVADPASTVSEIYKLAGLDITLTEKFKLQAKKSMNLNGQRAYTFGGREKAEEWYQLDELCHYLRPDVNENQISRLSPADKSAFLDEAQTAMCALGYL